MPQTRERRAPTTPPSTDNSLPTPETIAVVSETDFGESLGDGARHTRWNFGALVMDVSCFAVGMACFDLSAVLPLLMERLGANGTLIGAFAAVRFLVFSVFQMFVAYHLHGRPRQKPFLLLVAGLTRLPLLALPFFLWHGADSNTGRLAALAAAMIALSIWALGDGLGYVPWMEIVARAFSDRTRGRFFATTQFLSGAASIGVAALIVRPILASSELPFPHNYAILAGLAAVMFQFSTVGILLIKEPPAPTEAPEPRPPLRDYFRRLPELIRANPIFARLAVIQLLLGFGSASAPFYVLHATARFHLGDQWGGIFQTMQAVGVVALMPAWALLSERRGPATSVRAVGFACLLTPLLAMTLGSLSPWLFGLVFLLMGGSLGWGLWITMNHFLLTHITEDERPIFVALLNLLFVPSALYPFLGGLLVQQKQLVTVGGVPVLLALTTAVITVGFVLALRLPAPEQR